VASAQVRAAPAPSGESLRSQRSGWVPVAALFAIAALVYVALGLLQQVPLVTPDEYTYAKVSQSLADGHGLSWRGSDEPFRAPLYLYFLAACWKLLSVASAYTLAKALGAVALCSIVVPTWIVARELLPDPRTALIPCVLTVLGTWMTTSSTLVTENVAFPLAAGALSAAVLAIVRGNGRVGLVAVALALVAAATRAQLLPLAGVVAAAFMLDVAVAADRPARLRVHRAPLSVVAGLAVIAAIVALVSGAGSLGTYSGLSVLRPSLGAGVGAMGHQWLALCTMSGVLPVVVVLAGAPRAWRTAPDVRAVYLVAVPAALVLVAQTGWYLAGIDAGWSIQRYVEYPVPLLLVAMVVLLDRGLVSIRGVLPAGAVVAGSLLALPETRRVIEERGAYGLEAVIGRSAWAPALLALLLAAGAALALRRCRPRRAVIAVAALAALPLLVQSVAGWHWQIDLSRLFRQQYPADLAWVDHHGDGPVARIFVYANSPLFDNAELFNRDVATVLRSPLPWRGRELHGGSCRWSTTDAGQLTADGACLAAVTRIWNDDPLVRMSFYGGHVLARDPRLGQLIAVGARPRIRSLIVLPCNRATPAISPSGADFHMPRAVECNGYLSARLFLDGPGTLNLVFRGGAADHQASRGARTWTLAARGITRVALPVGPGATTTTISTDWTTTSGAPQVVGATLVTRAGTTSLL
jgi:uncharacterized membrane protein